MLSVLRLSEGSIFHCNAEYHFTEYHMIWCKDTNIMAFSKTPLIITTQSKSHHTVSVRLPIKALFSLK